MKYQARKKKIKNGEDRLSGNKRSALLVAVPVYQTASGWVAVVGQTSGRWRTVPVSTSVQLWLACRLLLALLAWHLAAMSSPASLDGNSYLPRLTRVVRRDPELAAILSQQLAVPGACASLVAVQAAVAHLVQCGFEAPTWPALLAQNGPWPPSVEDDSPGFGRGWQQTASAVLDLHFANERSSALDPASAAMLLSQSGPAAAQVFTMLPTCRELVIEPQHFRVLLLRRLRMPLPFSPARCSCGRMCDALGDHRSACPRAGVLRGRGVPLERAAAIVCREAGATVSMHTLVRDLNIASVPGDDRRIEVIANGLPLWSGAQLAIDTTLVSAAGPRRYQGWAALRLARRTKERTYPELMQGNSRCRLVVLAIEVGGRWSTEAVDLIRQLAKARARAAPVRLRGSCAAGLARRWCSLLAAAAHRAYAASLLALPPHSASNVDGDCPCGATCCPSPEPSRARRLPGLPTASMQSPRVPGGVFKGGVSGTDLAAEKGVRKKKNAS